MSVKRMSVRRGAAMRGSAVWAGIALALASVGPGCQRYERRPLDLQAHSAAFLARTPASDDVRAFAAALAARDAREPHAAAYEPADGITCEEAELIALVYNAELRVARLRAGVTRAGADHAGRWPDPAIGVDIARIVQGTPEPWKVFTSIGLTIPISGRLEIEKQRAGVEHAAELARVAQLEWRVRAEIRRAWTHWSATEARLAAAREFADFVGQVTALVDTLERAGEIARIEARLFRIESASASAERAALESQVREAALRLRHLMGLSPSAPVVFSMAGVGPAFPHPDDDAGSASLEMLRTRSLAVGVAAAEYEAAEKALELEVRKQYPDLQIGPGYGREDGQDQVLLGLNLPIPLFDGNRRGIEEAMAKRESARANAEAVLEQASAALEAARARLDGARRSRELLESEIVPMVDAQYADARRLAQLGEVNAPVLLESLARQQAVKAKLIDARRDEALALIDLAEVAGPPLVRSGGTRRDPVTPSERHDGGGQP